MIKFKIKVRTTKIDPLVGPWPVGHSCRILGKKNTSDSHQQHKTQF